MRNLPNPLVEPYRVRKGTHATSEADGNNGMFLVPCGKVTLKVLASDGLAWAHVSVSLPDRCPTWEEMCHVKELFWRSDEAVMQLHPPRSEYVNYHPHCLHLWRPLTEEEMRELRASWAEAGEPYPSAPSPGIIPLPPALLVGPRDRAKGVNA
jgi:hypothetical protein